MEMPQLRLFVSQLDRFFGLFFLRRNVSVTASDVPRRPRWPADPCSGGSAICLVRSSTKECDDSKRRYLLRCKVMARRQGARNDLLRPFNLILFAEQSVDDLSCGFADDATRAPVALCHRR